MIQKVFAWTHSAASSSTSPPPSTHSLYCSISLPFFKLFPLSSYIWIPINHYRSNTKLPPSHKCSCQKLCPWKYLLLLTLNHFLLAWISFVIYTSPLCYLTTISLKALQIHSCLLHLWNRTGYSPHICWVENWIATDQIKKWRSERISEDTWNHY